MSLRTLAPRLKAIDTRTLPTLQPKAGTTPRERGRAWMRKRDEVALAHGYRCAGCGCVWVPNRDQVDHRVPLEQGGSNDDANLQLLCTTCHEAKTTGEAGKRRRAW